MDWTTKLLQFGIPQDLAIRMTPSLNTLPYQPEQFTSIQQLVPVMQSYGMASLDWWTDLMAAITKIIQALPAIVLIGVGGALAYFLRNVKIGKIPLGILGLIPIGIGTYVMIQPFLPTAPAA